MAVFGTLSNFRQFKFNKSKVSSLGKNLVLGRRSYKPDNHRQEKLYTHNPDRSEGDKHTLDRVKAEGQEAGGILQSLE